VKFLAKRQIVKVEFEKSNFAMRYRELGTNRMSLVCEMKSRDFIVVFVMCSSGLRIISRKGTDYVRERRMIRIISGIPVKIVTIGMPQKF